MKKIIVLMTILILLFSATAFATRQDFYNDASIWTKIKLAFSGTQQSTFGDKQCCNACQPIKTDSCMNHQGQHYTETAGGIKAVIDIYISGQPYQETFAPASFDCTGYYVDKYSWEVYGCTISTGCNKGDAGCTPALDKCSSDADCQVWGSTYICDTGYCHQSCTINSCSEWSACSNGVQTKTCTRPSYCANNQITTTQNCQSPIGGSGTGQGEITCKDCSGVEYRYQGTSCPIGDCPPPKQPNGICEKDLNEDCSNVDCSSLPECGTTPPNTTITCGDCNGGTYQYQGTSCPIGDCLPPKPTPEINKNMTYYVLGGILVVLLFALVILKKKGLFKKK